VNITKKDFAYGFLSIFREESALPDALEEPGRRWKSRMHWAEFFLFGDEVIQIY
jgi:hypothetical protein